MNEKPVGMDIKDFYAKLARICAEGKCGECPAEEFCFTAPKGMKGEIIDKAVRALASTGAPRKPDAKEGSE